MEGSRVGDARTEILLEYTALFDGESKAGELCPACKGGRTGEQTLSVARREGTLVWNCHRASCGFKGRETGASRYGPPATIPASTRGLVGRQAIREAEPLPAEIADMLATNYGLTDSLRQRSGIAWSSEEARIVIPIKDFDGEPAGAVLRSFSGAKPKAITHADDGAMACYPKRGSRQVIIVEDQLSAIRASEYMNAVALLGVNLNEERAYAIRKQAFEKCWIALDADAAAAQARLVIKNRGILKLIPLILKKDLKAHSEQELQEFFNEHT